MEEKKKETIQEEVIKQLNTFQNLEDMVLFLVGYMEALFDRSRGERTMDGIFPETMFNKSFLKELGRKKSLEEMQDTLTEYCRQILEKAINKKAKKLYEQFMAHSVEERHQMLGLKKGR